MHFHCLAVRHRWISDASSRPRVRSLPRRAVVPPCKIFQPVNPHTKYTRRNHQVPFERIANVRFCTHDSGSGQPTGVRIEGQLVGQVIEERVGEGKC